MPKNLTITVCALALLTLGTLLNGAEPSEEKAPQPLRIHCIGDSITQADPYNLSWRYALWKKFIEADMSVDFVGTLTEHYDGTPEFPPINGKEFDQDHDGRWGWTTSKVAEELPLWLETIDADIALVHLGTNDCLMGNSAETVIDRLQSVVQVLQKDNPKITILVAQIIPCQTPRSIPALNAALPEAAKKWTTETSKVQAVDMFTDFDVDGMLYDGLHPHEDGEEFMAERWFKAIKGLTAENQEKGEDSSKNNSPEDKAAEQ